MTGVATAVVTVNDNNYESNTSSKMESDNTKMEESTEKTQDIIPTNRANDEDSQIEIQLPKRVSSIRPPKRSYFVSFGAK